MVPVKRTEISETVIPPRDKSLLGAVEFKPLWVKHLSWRVPSSMPRHRKPCDKFSMYLADSMIGLRDYRQRDAMTI